MRFDRIAAFCAASVLAGTARGPRFRPTPYDGIWHVTIVTKSGTCEPTASSTLTVTDGKISARRRQRFRQHRTVRALCKFRSMVHMRTVNSAATPDRESGMEHQLAYRAAGGGKHRANRAIRN